MIVSSLKELEHGELRVAITPEICKKYIKLGFSVLIEKDAGVNSNFSNKAYLEAGALLVEDKFEIIRKTDVLLSVTSIPDKEVLNMSKKLIIIGTFNNKKNIDLLKSLELKEFSIISLDLLPRISRAQSMDVLSSQANLAGYKAVILACNLYKKAFPMMMTAAGTIIPAKCLVLGAGVAGLQAIATAKRLGCVVSAFDVRPEVEDQVKSLGAKFIKVDDNEIEENMVYAKEMSEEYKNKQKQKIHDSAKDMDIIITTAIIPGKKAPILLENKTLKSMKMGSVIIDMAGESGGNTQGAVFGKEIEVEKVIISSPTNLPSLVSIDASSLYAKNVLSFVSSFINEEKKINIKSDDELLTKSIIVKDGVKTLNLKDSKYV